MKLLSSDYMYSRIRLRDIKTGEKQCIGFVTSSVSEELNDILSDETIYQKVASETGKPTYRKEDFLNLYKELREIEEIAVKKIEKRVDGMGIVANTKNINLKIYFDNTGSGKETADKFFEKNEGPYELCYIEKDGTKLI